MPDNQEPVDCTLTLNGIMFAFAPDGNDRFSKWRHVRADGKTVDIFPPVAYFRSRWVVRLSKSEEVGSTLISNGSFESAATALYAAANMAEDPVPDI